MSKESAVFEPVFTSRIIEGKAFMLLDKHIGPDNDNPKDSFIDGPRFAEEMYWLKAQGNEIIVKINSPGGRVDHGWSIIDAIKETKATTHLVGLGASMAGIAFLFGAKRIAEEHATLMLHAPRAVSGKPSPYLEIIRQNFSTLISSFSKLPQDKSEALMKDGDHFFDSSDMEEYGFVDEIKHNQVKFIKPVTASSKELYLAYASIIEKVETQKTLNMANILAKFFNKETEEEAIVAATTLKVENEQLKAKYSQLEDDKKALEDKVKAFEAKEQETQLRAKATELIASAEKAGKMKFDGEESRKKAIDNATANFEGTKAMIDSIPAVKASAAASFIDPNAKKDEQTYEYLANHQPKKLAEIAENDPELFAKLKNDFYARASEKQNAK